MKINNIITTSTTHTTTTTPEWFIERERLRQLSKEREKKISEIIGDTEEVEERKEVKSSSILSKLFGLKS